MCAEAWKCSPTCVRGCCKHSRNESFYLKSISYWLIFYMNYIHCYLVNWLMRRFWFVWFFLISQLYMHKLPYFKMHTDHVNSTLTLSTRVYTIYIFLFLFFLIFTVLYSAPPIPVGLQSFQQNPMESSGVQWNGTGFQWIPQDCRLKLK